MEMMKNETMHKNYIHMMYELDKSYDITSSKEMFTNMARFLLTRDYLGNHSEIDEENAQAVYDAMKACTSGVPGYFKGDADIFFDLFSTAKNFTDKDIFTYIHQTLLDMKEIVGTSPAILFDFSNRIAFNKPKRVFLAEVEKYDKDIYEFLESHQDCQITVSTKSRELKYLFSVLFNYLPNVEVIVADIYDELNYYGEFDMILVVPAFDKTLKGVRDASKGYDRRRHFIATKVLLKCLAKEGALVSILPADIANRDRTHAFRRYILSKYSVEEIGYLPDVMFKYTSLQTYIVVFKYGKSDTIVSKYVSDWSEASIDRCLEMHRETFKVIPEEEFRAKDDWNVDVLFANEDPDVKAYFQSPIPKEQLCYLGTVFKGRPFKKGDEGEVQMINITNISDGNIDLENLETVDATPKQAERVQVTPGDILITSRGTQFKMAYMDRWHKCMCVPSHNIIVISPDENKINSIYLLLFLESPVGMKLLKSLQRGSHIVNISHYDVETLEVPIVDRAKQDEIAEKYLAAKDEYERISKQAKKEFKEKYDNIISDLY